MLTIRVMTGNHHVTVIDSPILDGILAQRPQEE
jgi:hypothetical protein